MNTRVMFASLAAVIMLPGPVLAAAPIINEPIRPYEPLAADAEIEREQIYLGELIGDPHMYEVTLGEEKFFSMTLMQEQKENTVAVPFSFILVKDNQSNRGVTEIGRLEGKKVEWLPYRDSSLALKLMRGETYTAMLAPGVYRFEVSTPQNLGKYMMVVGTESAGDGYFSELKNIRSVQEFFDHSLFRLFISTNVLYPLGSIILLILIYLTWYKNRRPKVVSSDSHA